MQSRQTRDVRVQPMFGNVPVNTMATHRRKDYERESDLLLWVAGLRVKVVSPYCPGCSTLTRRPAPGVLPVGIARGNRIAENCDRRLPVCSKQRLKAAVESSLRTRSQMRLKRLFPESRKPSYATIWGFRGRVLPSC